MATYTIEESTLTGIADAIRGKLGSEDRYTSAEMAEAIAGIEAKDPECNGMHVPEEALVISKTCKSRFANDGWTWFISEYGGKITAENIGDADSMFSASTKLEEIPFDFIFANDTYYSYSNMFHLCTSLKSIGKLVNMYPSSTTYMFSNCNSLRYLPEFENLNLSRMQTYTSANMSYMFQNCYSLRSISEDFLKQFYGNMSYYASVVYGAFSSCYAIDEIKGLNPKSTAVITSNILSSTFSNCSRAKEIVFAVQDDGAPYVCSWKNQTLDMNSIGFSVNGASMITKYNSGLTTDTEVTDDASYQALKDNPDWWTTHMEYSRYNHDSAVNTINSLPDTSAYLATAGGTNTIRFRGRSGEKTDGGAINTLTEEEISQAVAKGWTVSFL